MSEEKSERPSLRLVRRSTDLERGLSPAELEKLRAIGLRHKQEREQEQLRAIGIRLGRRKPRRVIMGRP